MIGILICLAWVIVVLAALLLLDAGSKSRAEERVQTVALERDLLRVRLTDAAFAVQWNAHVAQALAVVAGVELGAMTADTSDLHKPDLTVDDITGAAGGEQA